MARNIAADGGPVFRAVITSTPPGGPRATWHEGPYATHAAARARVTYWTNHLRDHTDRRYASGYVERTDSTWRRADEQTDPTAGSRAQAYRAAADEINALPQDFECDPGRGNAAEYLRRRADEIEAGR